MRPLVAVALIVACGRDERAVPPVARDSTVARAPRPASDGLVLRVPRSGGIPRVVGYPDIDSTIATASDKAPAIERILGFDDDAGQISFVDTRGLPGRIDFRLGAVTQASRAKLRGLATNNGSTIYGIDGNGGVVRLTPEGDWSFKPPRPARSVFPLNDGTILVLAADDESSTLWRLRPPETKVIDSMHLSEVLRGMATQTGDRVYVVSAQHALVGITVRGLRRGSNIGLGHDVAALVATPSGDRVFIALDSTSSVAVVDRYRDRITRRIELPGEPRDLRIDPLGRYLLARPAKGDSVWVIALATDRVVGTVRSTWRSDLPFVAPDGAIVVVNGRDVVMMDGAPLAERRRAADGAADFWFAFQWTGFNPRSASLDQPVDFSRKDSTDTTKPPPRPAADTAPRPVVRAPAPVDSTPRGFVVSFAALLSEARARELAAQIHVRGQNARVVATEREGTTIYRVLLGPYMTRVEAENVGRESGQSYWVYEGIP